MGVQVIASFSRKAYIFAGLKIGFGKDGGERHGCHSALMPKDKGKKIDIGRFFGKKLFTPYIFWWSR